MDVASHLVSQFTLRGNQDIGLKCKIFPFHLHSLKLFPEFVHLSGVLVPLSVTAGQGLLDLVELLLEAKHQFR